MVSAPFVQPAHLELLSSVRVVRGDRSWRREIFSTGMLMGRGCLDEAIASAVTMYTRESQQSPGVQSANGQGLVQMPGALTTQARVRVSPAGRPGDGDISDVPFNLVAQQLTLTAPNGGQSWVIGSTQQIQFTGNIGTSPGYTAQVSYDSGVTWQSLSTSGSGSTPFGMYLRWFVIGPATTHARVRVTWSGGGLSASDESDADFTIASRIRVTSPNSAVTWVLGSAHAITWTHDFNGAQMFDIDFSPDGGATWTPLALFVPANNATTGSYSWTVAGNPTTQALIRVSPTGAPYQGDTSDVPFTVAPPRIIP